MKKLIGTLCALFLASVASAQTIATCSDPKGHAYYPIKGVIKKADAGWSKDAITGGKVTLMKVGDQNLIFCLSIPRTRSSQRLPLVALSYR